MRYFFMGCLSALLIGCAEPEQEAAPRVPLISETNELVALVLNSPTTFYVDAEGKYAGLEYELVTRFAALHNLKVQFVIAKNYREMEEKLQAKQAHLAVGMVKNYETPKLTFGASYQDVSLVLVYPDTKTQTDVLQTIRKEQTPLPVPAQYVPLLNQWQQAMGAPLTLQIVEGEDSEALISAVAEGKRPFAVVDSLSMDVANNYYPNILSYKIPGSEAKLAWGTRAADPELLESVTAFFTSLQKDHTLRHLQELYYGHINRLQNDDAQAFLEKRKTILPRYKSFFFAAEKATGIDWRLLAALAYQESHWDPLATSPYGVRGIMMLTTNTAQRLGVTDRLDPLQSIMGGARYIKQLQALLPEDMYEMDKNWLALAAYNVGIGHLNDARQIARWQKKKPDSWADVKTTLPLLRQQEYFSKVKNGYARGGEPVIFVESVRTYYDILSRFEKPLSVVKPAVMKGIEVINPHNYVLAINHSLSELGAGPAKPLSPAGKPATPYKAKAA